MSDPIFFLSEEGSYALMTIKLPSIEIEQKLLHWETGHYRQRQPSNLMPLTSDFQCTQCTRYYQLLNILVKSFLDFKVSHFFQLRTYFVEANKQTFIASRCAGVGPLNRVRQLSLDPRGGRYAK